MEDILYILDNYSYVSEDNIRYAIHEMLAKLNHRSSIDYYIARHNSSLETEVKNLISDLMKVYRLPAGNPRKAYLADESSRIYFHELNTMNGWIEALREDRQPYEMYSYGHWIMFPGDGEIIRQFNLHSCTENRGYISYVYPEPWYGSPTSAKIIVLGNEARYDNNISRTQNIILSKIPSYAEAVQIMADNWLNLKHGTFYNYEYFGPQEDRLRVHDIYNSPSYRYWLYKIREFADYMALPRQKVFDNIAVINANPYTSLNVSPLEPGLMPSHYFLRQIVRYVVNHDSDVIFFLPSGRLQSVWQDILGDVYDDIVMHNRLFLTRINNSISLVGEWNKEQIDRIHYLLHY
ncbi:MAG: hypothetical protein HDS01_05145 [Bacteroides sp.]|nr:hypothetical protein [Bacteroides sp.]